jgi:hypothetical protein
LIKAAVPEAGGSFLEITNNLMTVGPKVFPAADMQPEVLASATQELRSYGTTEPRIYGWMEKWSRGNGESDLKMRD